MKLTLFILSFLFFTANLLTADSGYSISGRIINEKDGSPIPGASIRVAGTNKGAYSSTRGFFRVPFLEQGVKLKIKSIGYNTKFVEVSNNQDSVIVKLQPSPVRLNKATVVGDIEPEEVIKRAIGRKEDNQKKLKTMQGKLYSKLVMELDGSVFAKADNNSVSITATFGEEVPEYYKMFIMETYSRRFNDYEENVYKTEIIQRRQTSNLDPEKNLMALGSFFNLYDDEIKFIDAKFVTPLSSDALDFYDYEMLGRNILDDRFIYEIGVKPQTEVFPGLEGVIKIVEGSYDIVEADLHPSEETAISFVDSVRIVQKFEEAKKDVWYPGYLKVRAKAAVDVVKGLMDVSVNINATSIYSDVTVNEPLPDSIYEPDIKSLTVAALADSSQTDYWARNSMLELSRKEERIYAQVDSLVKADTSAKRSEGERSDFRYTLLMPYVDFNRVGSVSFGLSPSASYKNLSLNGTGAFSFGLQKPIGRASLSYDFDISRYADFELTGTVFSKLSIIGREEHYHRLVNTLIAGFFHVDYYDFYKSEGFEIEANAEIGNLDLSARYERSRNFNLSTNTNRSIFKEMGWRENPAVMEGEFQTIGGSAKYNFRNALNLGPNYDLSLSLKSLYGIRPDEKGFYRTDGRLEFSVPTFYTGYKPMMLNVLVDAGLTADKTPIQYIHKMRTRDLFIGLKGAFYSAPISKYAGKRYFAARFEFETSDILWRALGIRLYQGRGLDLAFNYSVGKYESGGYYKDTRGLMYSEAGVTAKRIPTFVSNVIYFGAGASWGLGPVASGNFGWFLTFDFPFD